MIVLMLDSFKDSQKSVLKERWQSLIKRESSLPAIGRSMTEGGEGPSAAEVATSFPARLLGAIEELWKFLNSWMKKKEEEESSSLKFLLKEKWSVLSTVRSDFYRLMSAWSDASKTVQAVVSN